MTKGVYLSILLAFAALTIFGKEIPMEVAKMVGINFYYERINQFYTTNYPDVCVKESFVQRVDGKPVYFIFNMEPDGYIAVSSDDAVIPVLAYSFEGPYDRNQEPEQFTAWMKQYEDQINDAIQTGLMPTASVQKLWVKYRDAGNGTRDNEPDNPFEENVLRHPSRVPVKISADQDEQPGVPHLVSRVPSNAVAPLIFSNWNQPAPYNEQCPADPAGPGGHTLVGCVPVCMGQLMYYYRWPNTGTGSYSYFDSTYGTISANFGNSTYEWDNMTNTATSSNPGIAKLLFHLGVSCDLVYGPNSSGMYNHKAAYALRTYFKYSPQTQYLYRDSTTLNWDSILIAHLDRRMPMYYAGWSVPNINGHAFVCDGYQDTAYFHFNFGWGGQSNGYFYTNNLTPGGNNFKLAQEVIINAYPDTVNYTYPLYCSGASRLTYPMGSITDGSSPTKNYPPSSDCSWLIDPQPADDSISSITLTFNEIKTAPGDNVIVYDGESNGYPVLATFSGDTIPNALTGTKNKMFIRFTGSSGSSAAGWSATYKTKSPVWCTGTTTIKADTAVFTDGSVGYNYHNNSLCRWIIQSKNGNPLTIYFRRFDTEPGKDFLRIYDMATGDTLADLSGHYVQGSLPDSVTSPDGKMMLIFITNSSITGTGWEVYYPQSHVGMNERQLINDLNIFPNPSREIINIEFTMPAEGRVNFRISDMTGKMLRDNELSVPAGQNKSQLDISGLQSGVYIFQMITDQGVQNRKLIIN